MKSLDKKKPSELFEGVNSTLHQAFVKAVERDKKKTNNLPSDVRNKVVKPNKPKELDWHIKWDYLLNKKKWKNPDEVNKVLTKFVEDLFTQQRTELEQQKVKVVWNNVCEQIKKDTIEQILNLECLKEEEFDESDDVVDEEVREKRNQLRKEIIDEISKL